MRRTPTTLRRGLVGGLGALVAAVVLAGCIPTPPPVSLPAPTVISAEVTPVVVAGTSLTAVLRTFHPVGVSGMNFRVQAANGASFWSTESPSERPDECRSRDAVWVSVEVVAGAEAEASGSCTMPTYSINGTWILTASVGLSGYQSTTVTVPFEVVGGIDDPGPPMVTMVAPTGPVVAGTTFDLTLRIEDANLRPDTDPRPMTYLRRTSASSPTADSFLCRDRVLTWVSPTVVETTSRCELDLDDEPGIYEGRYHPLADVLGRTTEIRPEVVVIAP